MVQWTHLENRNKSYKHDLRISHESEQTYDYQEGREGGINWEIGIDIYTLLYIIYIRTYV